MASFELKRTAEEQKKYDERKRKEKEMYIEKDKKFLNDIEEKLESEIAELLKQGKREGCTELAQRLVRVRREKRKAYPEDFKKTSVGAQSKATSSNVAIAGATESTSQAMGSSDEQTNSQQVTKTMEESEEESTDSDISDYGDCIYGQYHSKMILDTEVEILLDVLSYKFTGKLIPAQYSRNDLFWPFSDYDDD